MHDTGISEGTTYWIKAAAVIIHLYVQPDTYGGFTSG